MPTDIEEQIATYFAWVEERTGFRLRPVDTVELDRMLLAHGSSAAPIEVVGEEGRGRSGLRRILVGALAAAAVIGAIVIAKRPDEHPLSPSGTTDTVVPAPIDPQALDKLLERIRLRNEALRQAQAATAAAEAAERRAQDEAARATVAGSIDQELVGPQGAFTVRLPPGFQRQGSRPAVPDDRLFSATYVDGANHMMLTVSVERGVVVDAISATDPNTRTIDGLRPEGPVIAVTDPATNDESMWWAADSTTVVWVYGYGIADELLRNIVTTIAVRTP